MDLKSEFFAKLKKLCWTLETETAQLQQTFNYRHGNADCEAAAKGMRACHDVNCDVLGLKGQLQDELSKQKAHKTDTDSFIHACRAMQSKVAHDVRELTAHFEDYAYQNSTDACPSHAEDATMEEESADNEEEEEEDNNEDKEQEEEEEVAEDCSNLPTSPLAAAPTGPAGPLSTPKLSDFGLCELYLHQRFSGCGQQPAIPELSLPRLDVPTPLPPTPRCALRMDEDELRTPQMRDLGLSEDTMCFNDFTMELFKKTADKRQAQDLQAPPVPALTESLQEEENLKSPEPPVFCTPGFKIKKTNGHCSPPPRVAEGGAPSPSAAVQLPVTPEVPAFQTPSLKRLLSSKMREPLVAESKDSHSMPLLETPRDGSVVVGRRAWEYDVPELRIPGVQESADLDEATPDFHLSPPRATREIYEISTPKMPDLSSITQDICNLVLQSQKPPKKERKSRCMNAVSKQEFRSLPAWLKQITLNNLNQAVRNINQYLVQCPGEDTREFGMEELKKITDVGIKAPVYLLCLSELKRLEHVEGVRNNAIYKLNLCSRVLNCP